MLKEEVPADTRQGSSMSESLHRGDGCHFSYSCSLKQVVDCHAEYQTVPSLSELFKEYKWHDHDKTANEALRAFEYRDKYQLNAAYAI